MKFSKYSQSITRNINAQMLRVPGSKVFSRKNTSGTSCTRSIWALCTAGTRSISTFCTANTRSISRFCTANTATLEVFWGSILWNTAVLEVFLGFDTLECCLYLEVFKNPVMLIFYYSQYFGI